uniref:Hedgehog protein Hint domain-containing protein n=1 Tax=Chromera velia CCMP2878 TaxID=1169474 RepID=A0A0G4IBJ0_9ALVE|eukprot:Cvel_2168.t1-p1 / transcript=Cvel_2168.t1 / gene=Cvel_2168 / organism=Chromera_velia_CCMP2878 / gene_product=Indian hedgehog protein, putative / transcript_product=Indian hedgehog protein, putative / location=Cvel_scaffold84:29696-32123(-) / protein_length=537 / sequence_SO=supercontig / SO=protein_coding / is_pseudo=false
MWRIFLSLSLGLCAWGVCALRPPPVPAVLTQKAQSGSHETHREDVAGMLANETFRVCETAFEMENEAGLLDSWESVRDRIDTACDSATKQAFSITHKDISESAERECKQLEETLDHLQKLYPDFDHSVEGLTKHVVCSTAALAVGGDGELVKAAEEALAQIPKLFGVAIETEKKAMQGIASSLMSNAQHKSPTDRCSPFDDDPACVRNGGGADCFPGRALVTSEKHGAIPISELQVGDRVRDDSGWTGVLFFFHRQKGGTDGREGTYMQADLANGGRLEISPAHFAYRCADTEGDASSCEKVETVLAALLRVGDRVLVSGGAALSSPSVDQDTALAESKPATAAAEMVPVRISSLRETRLGGAYEPITSSGRLLVDGVLVSSFSSQKTNSLPENLRKFADPETIFSLTWPLRMWHSSFGLSNGCEYGPLGDRLGHLVASLFFHRTWGLFPPTEPKEERDSLHPVADLARHVLKKTRAGLSIYEGLSFLQRFVVFAVVGRDLDSVSVSAQDCPLAGSLKEASVHPTPLSPPHWVPLSA